MVARRRPRRQTPRTAILEATRSRYPNAEDQSKVHGTVHFARVPESMDEKITAATGTCQQAFEEGSLVTFGDAVRLPGSIVQLIESDMGD